MGEPRRAVRRYRFVGDSAGGEERAVLVLRVPEVLDPQYGMYAWPCAVVLAQYVWFHRRTLPGHRVLEIGAGVSLPGIVAAKCGAQVTLSDSEELPQCLEISQQSYLLNHLPHVPVVGITWGRISPELLSLAPIDIILGSDVFFDPKGTLSLSGTSDLRQTAKTPFTHAVNRKQNVPIAIVPELVILAVIPALNYYTNTTAG